MRVKMKEGCPPMQVRMFGKRWKIPKDDIPREVFNKIKDKVIDPNKKVKKKVQNEDTTNKGS